MEYQLTLTRFIERAELVFGDREVVSATDDVRVRHTWGEIGDRVRRLASGLAGLGVEAGSTVATLAWNHHRHLELYFAVPALGAVLHTVNPRLPKDRIGRLFLDGGAGLAYVDSDLEELAPDGVELVDHEALVAGADPLSTFPELDEWSACGLCHTSGTTGRPKGVLYSHRALVLHSLGISLPDGFGLGESDTIMPVVPMFHAGAWGLPYAAAMTGAGLVLPGPRPDAGRVADLLSSERVTFAAAVPTVWMDVLDELRERPRPLRPGLRIHSGGAPSPAWLIDAYREELGVEVVTGWGMTEISPVGAVAHPRGRMAGRSDAELSSVRTSQGTPLPLVELRVVPRAGDGVGGTPAHRDGRSAGELEARGAWVTGGYLGDDCSDGDEGPGWLRTGDIATIDPMGYLRLVDRARDLVRSGGEWISSVELENAIMDLPSVAEAAVVAMPDRRWQERPCAFVVPQGRWRGELRESGSVAIRREVLAALSNRFPKWWLPDRVETMDALPRTVTGKFDKRSLRRIAARLAEGE